MNSGDAIDEVTEESHTIETSKSCDSPINS